MNRGAIILCGGRSARMGRDKATLPIGGETLLQRVAGRLESVIPRDHIVVVAAKHQELPPLAPGIRLAFDQIPGRGPLEGLSTGIAMLPPGIETAFVTGCDAPFLEPAFIQTMFDRLGDFEIAVPVDDSCSYGLAAVYRATVRSRVEQLLAANRFRVRDLFECCETNRVSVHDLRRIDPHLKSLINLNTPDAYQRVLGMI